MGRVRKSQMSGRLVLGGILVVLLVFVAAGTGAVSASADQGPGATGNHQSADSGPATHHDVSPPLRDIAPAWRAPGITLMPEHDMPARPPVIAADPVVQSRPLALGAPTVNPSFDGVGVGLASFLPNAAPPDTNGDVGPNHYVQTVNTDFAVFNKSGGLMYGPVTINTLWAGFGGGCQTNNDGDPVVRYDPIADRWIITQFSVTTLPYLQCVAVSTTGDPLGSYYRYSFSYGNTEFPDYPKLGVWPDGYYITFNIFNGGTTYAGAKVCVYDRAKMLVGQLATQQCFPNTSTSYGGLLPADLDGSRQPPAGSPNYVVALGATNGLVYWKFHVDWATPANTTLTGPTTIAGAPSYTLPCNGTGGTCVTQGGTTQQLDTLGDRLMFPLAYRNFGDHEALVVTHSVQAGTSTAVRWYELRVGAGSTVNYYQGGTYAPDASHRWMGSAALDQAGNMAVGYSVSSSTIKPQIHFTGRLAGDALGTLTQSENTMINGAGSQIGGLARWGDYSSMSVDPLDDCTFWYTTEYLKTNGSFNWSTRIGSFKLPGCPAGPPAPDYSLSASPASQTVIQGASTSYTVTVTPTGGFTGAVNFSVSGLPSGATGTFSPNPTTSTSTLSISSAATTPAGSYPLTITGTSGTLTRTTSATLVVNAPPPPADYSLSVSPASQSVVQGASTTYTVAINRTGGFAGAVSLAVSGPGAGATGSFNPSSTTGNSSTLTVSTTATAATGTFALTITGTSGALSRTASATLVVTTAPAGNFGLSLTPSSRSVSPGGSTTYTVNVTRTGGFSGAVSLTVTGLPAGASGTFSPNPATAASSTLTVRTSSTTPAGTFALTVTGTSGALTHTASGTLTLSSCVNGQGDC